MSSLLNSQGMVLATAMAVSGSVILYALCRQKPIAATQFAVGRNSGSNPSNLRSCIPSHEKKREKTKKRVHFADHVVESVIDDESFIIDDDLMPEVQPVRESEAVRHVGGMPANRMALYNGILQDRLQRTACSY